MVMELFAIRRNRCWGQGQMVASLCPRHSVTWRLRGPGFSHPSRGSFPFAPHRLTEAKRSYWKSQGFGGFERVFTFVSSWHTESFDKVVREPWSYNTNITWCRPALLTHAGISMGINISSEGLNFKRKVRTMIQSSESQEVLALNY